MKNVFYFRRLCEIGGIETWLYNISVLYGKNYDINIFYVTGDEKQVERLKKYVNVYKYVGQPIECEKAFFCFNMEIADKVIAKEKVFFVHGDYKTQNEIPHIAKSIDKVYAISELAKISIKELLNIDAEVVYNPLIKHEKKKRLKLISCTRLTKEKGKNRIIKLANMLNEHNVDFIWDIYTNDKLEINIKNIRYCKPQLDIADYIHEYDYLVQLSDCEGYCYSIVEALMQNVPVIVTDMPVMKEIGVIDKVNGFIVNFDLSNVNIYNILNSKFDFTYEPPKSDFEKLLVKGVRNMEKNYIVKAIKSFTDVLERTHRSINDVFECEKERYLYLKEKKAVELVEIKEIQEENKQDSINTLEKEKTSKNSKKTANKGKKKNEE